MAGRGDGIVVCDRRAPVDEVWGDGRVWWEGEVDVTFVDEGAAGLLAMDFNGEGYSAYPWPGRSRMIPGSDHPRMSPWTGLWNTGQDPFSQVTLVRIVSRPIGKVVHSGPERTAKATPHHWPRASWKRSA